MFTALFLLNLQVSEHASWSARYYKRIIDAALAAAGAPADLVQVRAGFGWPSSTTGCFLALPVLQRGGQRVGHPTSPVAHAIF